MNISSSTTMFNSKKLGITIISKIILYYPKLASAKFTNCFASRIVNLIDFSRGSTIIKTARSM